MATNTFTSPTPENNMRTETKTVITEKEQLGFLDILEKIRGASHLSGECSWQVHIPLVGGNILRVGLTDDDVAEHPGQLWWDTYPDPKPIDAGSGDDGDDSYIYGSV